MSGKRIIFYILAAFITGTFALVYIQYNSAKHVSMLIAGNKKLVEEFKVENELQELEKNVISVESKIRTTITTNDTLHLEGLKEQVAEIHADLDNLQQVSDDDSTAKYVDQLDTLVQQKLQLGNTILEAFRNDGVTAAKKLIIPQTEKQLTDAIIKVIQQVDSTRKIHLTEISASIEQSGSKAQQFSMVLIGFVLIAAACLFWYIINIIQKLIQSEKKVKEVVRIKENFMANMSHEIRTPMNAILGFTNLLQRQDLSNQSKEYVQTIQKAGENLLTIINDILDLSKLEAGMMRIESAPFSLRGLTCSVEAMFSNKAKEKGLLLTTKIADAVPDMLEGDAVRLTQILVNLVGNALKFTSKGSVVIYVTDEGREQDIVQTGITITDTGIGVEPAKLKKIFERFQQADDTVTRQFGGTGLGLSIVNDLVLLQHGRIDIESEPGIGTSFRLVIPYKISGEVAERSAVTQHPELIPTDFTHTKILVVEDNAINQNLVKHLFAAWRLNFDLAKQGKEAIELLKSGHYHLILMDIQMPEMDGYTTAQRVRHELKLDTPIIAMTAHALAGEREKCLGYGMNEYISKPIQEAQLHALISRFAKIETPTLETQPAAEKEVLNEYKYINLKYMKEVSRGNLDYERTVTEQFIEIIPEDLNALETAWHDKKTDILRQLAHDLKTTVSIMGLNETLQPYLDELEYNDLSAAAFQQTFSSLQKICNTALAEAKVFYTTIAV